MLVIGVGGLGQYGIKLLERLCASPIVAGDLDPEKLAKASAYGASHTLDASDPELGRRLLDLSGGLGVAAALDFAGSDDTLALALGSTRTGGKVLQVGLAGGTARLEALEGARFEVGFEVSLWGSLSLAPPGATSRRMGLPPARPGRRGRPSRPPLGCFARLAARPR